jgi:hypothetical protein
VTVFFVRTDFVVYLVLRRNEIGGSRDAVVVGSLFIVLMMRRMFFIVIKSVVVASVCAMIYDYVNHVAMVMMRNNNRPQQCYGG